MFTVKICGVVLIVLTCSAIGFLKSFSIKARYKKLSMFCEGLDALYEYIEQSETELFAAIKQSFGKCNFLCFENHKFFCKDGDLNCEEKTLIDEFLKQLGTSAKKAECDRIRSFKTAMQTRVKYAENDVTQKSKLYQTFGVCIGLTVGILLI